MHELSIVSQMLAIVEENCREHAIRQVKRLVMAIGEFTCVEKEALRFAFDSLSPDSIAAGAELVIRSVAPKAFCEGCQQEFSITFTEKNCPTCGIRSQKIVAGEELHLESIEGEEENETDSSEKECTE